MLLCVSTRLRGQSRRRLINVDVTDVTSGAELFRRLRAAYFATRNWRYILFQPKTMHYVKVREYLEASRYAIETLQYSSPLDLERRGRY